MVEDYCRYIVYVCPACGKFNSRTISIFDVGKNGTELFCTDCGEKVVSIKPVRSRYYINYRCALCEEDHTASYPQKGFWQRDRLEFLCDSIGIDSLYFGSREAVEELLSSLEPDRSTELLPPELVCCYEILKRLEVLSSRGAVSCSCCGASAVNVDLVADGILLTCRICGKSSIIRSDEESLDKLLNSSTYVIE